MEIKMPHASNVLSQTTSCIVTAEPTPALDAVLRERGWQVIVRADLHLAMAEVCLQHRARLARAGWSGARREHVALVLIPTGGPAPGALAAAEQSMIAAVQRYMPDVSAWIFDGVQLTAAGAAEPVDDATSPQTVNTAPRSTADDVKVLSEARPPRHRQRATSDAGETLTDHGIDDEEDDDDPARISLDELDMLFGEREPDGT